MLQSPNTAAPNPRLSWPSLPFGTSPSSPPSSTRWPTTTRCVERSRSPAGRCCMAFGRHRCSRSRRLRRRSLESFRTVSAMPRDGRRARGAKRERPAVDVRSRGGRREGHDGDRQPTVPTRRTCEDRATPLGGTARRDERVARRRRRARFSFGAGPRGRCTSGWRSSRRTPRTIRSVSSSRPSADCAAARTRPVRGTASWRASGSSPASAARSGGISFATPVRRLSSPAGGTRRAGRSR